MSEEQKLEAGDWCVIGRVADWHPRLPTFAVARVKRVTDKLVFADAHYPSQRDRKYLTQHPRENAIPMPDEAAAQEFVTRAEGYFSEATRIEQAAWSAYSAAISKMLSAPPSKGNDHGE